MYETEGVVIWEEGENAFIQAQRKSTCGGCAKSSESCGTASLLGFFERKAPLYKARNTIGAKTGERVVIGLPELALLKGASAIYLPALLLLMAGAIGGHQLGASIATQELFSVIGAGIGLLAGFFWSRRQSASMASEENYCPVILSRTPHQFVVNLYGDHQ
jgi:sigma-E factor negative regulatory protein RseC